MSLLEDLLPSISLSSYAVLWITTSATLLIKKKSLHILPSQPVNASEHIDLVVSIQEVGNVVNVASALVPPVSGQQ